MRDSPINTMLLRSILISILGVASLGHGAEPARNIQIEPLHLISSGLGSVNVREVMKDEVPGVITDYMTFVGPVHHVQAASSDENVVWFFLGGIGTLQAKDRTFQLSEETIARVPLGWTLGIEVPEGETILALRFRKALSGEDRAELSNFTLFQSEPYIRTFRECIPYGEAIKSQKTVSRTLLPQDVVPRMAAGTVETTGPDRVLRHKHPMLEQYFVGLRGNDSAVSADNERVIFPELSILHIPLGSMHGAEVSDGNKLYYIWLDFFATKESQVWLKTHKPIQENAADVSHPGPIGSR